MPTNNKKSVSTPLHLLQQLSHSLLEHLEKACTQALVDAEELLTKLEKQRGKAQAKLHEARSKLEHAAVEGKAKAQAKAKNAITELEELLETLALVDGQWRHLPDHLARLRRAAVHFHYPADDEAGLQQALQRVQQEHPQGAWRVRLLLDAAGHWHLQAQPLAATPQPVCLALASAPFAEAHSEFTRYKTTRRAHYAAFAPVPGSGVFDTVLYNAAGEITETTFGNIAALLDGQWVTPPLACGLLPGVGRAQALRAGRVREGVLHLHDIPRVQAWAFINSLRGWLPAQLLQPVANVDNRGV